MIVELARLFQREARAHLALSGIGVEPCVEQLRVASEEGGAEPYLQSFRLVDHSRPWVRDPVEYTVTITRSDGRRQ